MKNLYANFFNAQSRPHENLGPLIKKYLLTNYSRPITPAQKKSFDKALQFINSKNLPVILDFGVGTGLSTKNLAKAYPDHCIIGIERSLDPIRRSNQLMGENFIILRADIFDFARLLSKQKINIAKQFIFYPNPYPKKSQFKKRIYVHPAFKSLIKLSTQLEIRCNWSLFAQEAAIALEYLGLEPKIQKIYPNEAISLFEKKYLENDCPIYSVTI